MLAPLGVRVKNWPAHTEPLNTLMLGVALTLTVATTELLIQPAVDFPTTV